MTSTVSLLLQNIEAEFERADGGHRALEILQLAVEQWTRVSPGWKEEDSMQQLMPLAFAMFKRKQAHHKHLLSIANFGVSAWQESIRWRLCVIEGKENVAQHVLRRIGAAHRERVDSCCEKSLSFCFPFKSTLLTHPPPLFFRACAHSSAGLFPALRRRRQRQPAHL